MRISTIATTLLAAIAAISLTATPAVAADADQDPGSTPGTEAVFMTLTGSTPGTTVQGLMPPSGPIPPANVASYPSDDPSGYFGVAPTPSLFDAETLRPSGASLQLYSVQYESDPGANYESVTREALGNPNIGYAMRVVDNSYPLSPDTASGRSSAEQIAIAQAAVWWYTDGFVVATSDPIHDAVVAVVTMTNAQGPVAGDVETTTLALEGASWTAVAGELAGPYTAASPGAANFTVDAGSATVYSDEAGTTVVPPGTILDIGASFWVRSDSAGTVELRATAGIVTPPGQIFMDGTEYQALVSAMPWTFDATASGTVEFTGSATPPGEVPGATSAPPTPTVTEPAAETTAAAAPSPAPTTTPGQNADGLAQTGGDDDGVIIAGSLALLALAVGAALLATRRSPRR